MKRRIRFSSRERFGVAGFSGNQLPWPVWKTVSRQSVRMEWNIGCVLTGVNRWKVSGACELSEDGVSFMLSGGMKGFPCTGCCTGEYACPETDCPRKQGCGCFCRRCLFRSAGNGLIVAYSSYQHFMKNGCLKSGYGRADFMAAVQAGMGRTCPATCHRFSI